MSDRELKRIKTKRGRPPIDLDIKRFIAEKALEDRDRPRKELAYELERLIQEKGLLAPTVETLKKKISEARQKPLPLDQPFSLGALVKNPIPPEALPMVLRVWAKRLEEAKPDKDGFSFKMTFSIRDALWVARLSSLLDDPEAVWGFAFWYSVRERAYEAIGEDIDTSDLDTEVLKSLKLIEREPGEDKMTPWVVEGDYLKDSTGKIRALNEDPYQPKGKKKKGGTS